MPKRKLSDRDIDPESQSHSHPKSHSKSDAQKSAENKEIKLQTARLKQQFDFGVTSLSRALKAARISERQKLGRRQKEVKVPAGAEDDAAGRNAKYKKGKKVNKNKKGDVDPQEAARRIEGEIAVLKTLDPTKCAEKYLFKQLAKTKRIEETQVFYRFKQAKKLTVEAPKSTEEANVTARLFMSQPVKNVLPGIMEGLRALFGLDKEGGNKDKKGTGKGIHKDNEQAQREVSIPVSNDEDNARDEDIEMEDADSGSDSEEEDEEDYSAFDARLAPDSDEEEEESGDEDALSRPQIRRSSMSITPSPEPSPEPSISLSDRSPSPPPTKKPKPTGKEPKAPATSTTFLPSLMMGGYWSGSENDESDADAENAADDIAPKRKNRMGQQARRALWEKKYGAHAKHVQGSQGKGKNGKGKGKGRDSGWDLRKGATGDGDGGDRRRFGTGSNSMAVTGERRFGAGAAGAGAGDGKDAKKKADASKPLHPSWEAARKAKEAKATAAFSGKKVVFD